MTQPMLELFEDSTNVLSGRKASVTALGPRIRKGRDEEGPTEVLGHLIWYSIPDAIRMTPEAMSAAIADAGMEPKALMPRAPTLSAALTRACEAALKRSVPMPHTRDGSPMDDLERTLSVHFDATGRGNKQAVTVVLDHEERRLSYEPFASADVDEGKLRIERLLPENSQALPPETEALKVLREAFAFERHRHDGEAVRRVITRALGHARAIPFRKSGAVYFIKHDHSSETEEILRFVAHVAVKAGNAPHREATTPIATHVELADKAQYRKAVKESLDQFVDKESRALIREMAELSRSGNPVTKKRVQKLLARVSDLKGSVAEYEELLETRATAAQANLEVAAQKARGLLDIVSG